MRVYIITQKEMDSLLSRLELCKLRHIEHLSTHDPKKIEWQDMHRSFHMCACNWIDEVGK